MLAKIATVVMFIVWCFVCQHYYVCHIKQKCGDTEVAVTTPTPDPEPVARVDNRPLVFKWKDSNPITRANFPAYRDSMLNLMKDGQILEIVGLYSEDEPAPEGFPNMGKARATALRDMLLEFIPAERMLPVSRLITLPDDAATKPFEGIVFNYIDPTDEEEAEIVEVDDRVIIQFPFSSAEKEPDPQVDAYLEKLAGRLKNTTEKVAITGHTDNVGSDKTNERLGRLRARHVRDILIEKGIDSGRITIDSKGESEPVADNDTEAGRRKNRRAELVLMKN